MKNLLHSFEKISDKYFAQRERYQKIIDGLSTKRSMRGVYQRGSLLLQESDQLASDLKTALNSPAGTATSEGALKEKIYKLKKYTKELHELTKPLWRQWIEAVVVALGLALVLRNFVFGLYHVPTGSAEPNILVGDRLWGNKMAYFFAPVKRGDLVIFDNPTFDYDRSSSFHYLWQRYIGFPIPLLGLGTGPDNWVKRAIAVPGDTIEGRVEYGKTVVYLNGKKLDEPYVNNLPLITLRKSRGFIPFEHFGPFAVPSFLRYEELMRRYTYDPSKPYDKQPYYYVDEDAVVHRMDNDQPDLTYPYTPSYDHHVCHDVYGPYIVPPGKYWVMGDSRKNSTDSRWWLFLDEKLVHGRASFVIWSVDSEESFWLFELIKHPIDFWKKNVRWDRFFSKFKHFTIGDE